MVSETLTPLNRAHLYARQADRCTQKGDFEGALQYHKEAASLLECASSFTQNEKALLSLKFQREYHLKQENILQIKAVERSQSQNEKKETASKNQQQKAEEVDQMKTFPSYEEPFVQVQRRPCDLDSDNGDKTTKLLLNYIRKQQIQIISLSDKLRQSELENRLLRLKIAELEQGSQDFQ